jgi:hypothetical protein
MGVIVVVAGWAACGADVVACMPFSAEVSRISATAATIGLGCPGTAGADEAGWRSAEPGATA